jgi:hypothetical protein
LAKAFWVKATPLHCPKIVGGAILGKCRSSALPENRQRSHFWVKADPLHCPKFVGGAILGKSNTSALPENRRRSYFGEKQHLCFARKSSAESFWVKATPLLCPKIVGGVILGKSNTSALPENRWRRHFG